MTKKKRKPGRLPVFIDLPQVELLASRGLTLQQICDSIGISHQTMNLRKHADAELVEAINRGRAAGLKMITNALFETAMGGNVAAQIFFLKNRAPETWRDKIDIEVEQSVPLPLVIEIPCIDVTPETTPTLSLNEGQNDHKIQ